MDCRCSKHPDLIFIDADNTGGLAVRHRKVSTEALQRGERYVYGRLYTMTLYALSQVILT
jgi:hypothetical protein